MRRALLFLSVAILSGCASAPDYRLNEAITRGDAREARDLLEESTEIIQHDSLSLAIKGGHKDLVELLIAYHADVNGGPQGERPLLLAMELDDPAIVKLLADNHANFELPDAEGTPIWHTAIKNSRKDVVEIFLSRVRNINHRGSEGKTPLLVALENKNTPMVEWLLARQADANFAGKNGVTPLHTAISMGTREMVEILLRHQARINVTDSAGLTPLHYAAQSGRSEMASLLIERRALINAKTLGGWTPLDLARFNEHEATAKVIRAHGGREDPIAGKLRRGMKFEQVERIVGRQESLDEMLTPGTNMTFRESMTVNLCGKEVDSHYAELRGFDRKKRSFHLAFKCGELVSWSWE
jgi:hypothetical protein